MERLAPFFVFAALLASAATAAALPEGTVFSVVVPDGPDLTSAEHLGTIYFELDNKHGDGCCYYAVWERPPEGAAQADCWIDESKMDGHADCFTNSQATFSTLVVRDQRARCVGFDTLAQPHDLALLVGLETPAVNGIVGLILFAGGQLLYPFEATPYP